METKDIFILALFRHGFKARGQTILHLLRGRRTSSVLIYGFFYRLLPYFGLFPKYQDIDLQNTLLSLEKNNYLNQLAEGEYIITTHGQLFLEEVHSDTHFWAELDGLRFSRGDELFWAQLLFATQVISELSFRTNNYVPIEGNFFKQRKLKDWLGKQVQPKELFYQAYLKELFILIESFPEQQRHLIVQQLSGHRQIGRTYQQLSSHKDWFWNELKRKEQLHHTLNFVLALSEEHLLKSLLNSLEIPFENQSAIKTIELFNQGLTIPQIMDIRQLKIGTVVDHLIEEVLVNQAFPFERLIQENQLENLEEFRKKNPDFRNWTFRQLLHEVPMIEFVSFRFYQLQQVREEGGCHAVD